MSRSAQLLLSLVPSAVCSALALAGCGGDNKEAESPPMGAQCPPGQYFDGAYCQPMQPAGPQATGTAPYPPQQPPPPTGGAPGQQQPPPQGDPSGPKATALDPAAAQAATQILNTMSQRHAPAGAKPIGETIAGQFQQGQSLERVVQMQPGKCYTVVGAGLPPVTELDIKLLPTMALPGLASPVIAQDQSTGPNAILGDKPNCFKWAFPIASPVNVVLTVSQGSGLAAAQVYEK